MAAERLAPLAPLFSALLAAPCILIAAAAGILTASAAQLGTLVPGMLVTAAEAVLVTVSAAVLLLLAVVMLLPTRGMGCGDGISRSAVSRGVIVWCPLLDSGHLKPFKMKKAN